MVIVDTDVLFLAFAFHRDPRRPDNDAFLQHVQRAEPALTVYSLMELLGKLSFNLAPEQLDAWPVWLIDAYQLSLIWPLEPSTTLTFAAWRDEIYARPLARMRAVRMPFMDALILNLAERTPQARTFVTWNARHFKEKSTLNVLTPAEYLAQPD